MKDGLRDWIADLFPSKKSESPIEQLFYASMRLLWDSPLMLPPVGVEMRQQEPVGNYRADFLFVIKAKDGQTKQLVVEMDGHDFHERTKQQATRDKTRDRWMTANKYQVMRFTGSEIWANPFKCASECADRLHQEMYGETVREARARAGLEAIKRVIEESGGQ